MHLRISFYLLLLSIFLPAVLNAQETKRVAQEQCATMERLQLKFARNPRMKAAFERENATFTNAVKRGAYRLADADVNPNNRTAYTIPVVFHIVSTNPASISDASIMAQLDVLNKGFSGTNGDSTRIPNYFKALLGKTGIQFCLAKRTPSGDGTTGIERIKTSQTSFEATNDGVKHASTGGADAWDTQKYLNVWLCMLKGQVLGYATFPNDLNNSANEQGVVIDYRAIPGGTYTNYNSGKTLVHETGHYFNLHHIWGDETGTCSDTDYIDDTPNQYSQTQSCISGVKTDACTPGGNGIMYQNYMDYSLDSCLVMFTSQQVSRMEASLIAYRSSLLTSNSCTPPTLKNYDARLLTIDQPAQRLCTSSFTPVVSIQNNGSQLLTSLDINTRIDNGTITNFTWKGSLAYLSSTIVSLSNISATAGLHTLTIYVSNPNNQKDEYGINDTVSTTIQFYNPVASLTESFESRLFPPTGWDIVNPDNFITWKPATGASKTGSASVMIENFNYSAVGATDDLRMPNVTLQKVDSAFLSFQVAAASYSDPNSNNSGWDTLQVLASTDCGLTYNSIYKKYGKDLVTRIGSTTFSFTPTATEWRKDSINLANYIGQPNLLLAFRNTAGYENNIYLDDVNLRTVIINPNLKRLGFLATPNPTNGVITVQFYPAPTNLRALQVYNISGQKLVDVNVASGQASNYYRLDITKYNSGTYIVRAVFTDRVVTRKIVKL